MAKLPQSFKAWGSFHVFVNHRCTDCDESDAFLAQFADDKAVRKLFKRDAKKRMRKLDKRRALADAA